MMGPTFTAGLTPVRQSLDNGAVVTVQETSATPAVAINATFLAGSLDEREDRCGVAYLTARLMAHGGGRILIGVVGAIVIGAGLYRLV